MRALPPECARPRAQRAAFRRDYGNTPPPVGLLALLRARTPARDHKRGAFGNLARVWGRTLTEAQRQAWKAAGLKVQSAKRLGQSGPLTGEQHFQGINSARAQIGREPLWEPPAQVRLGPSPVAQLIINNGEDGVRLLLKVAGPVIEDIMVFGQAPCSAGRTKRRNVSYLGLLPAPQGGMSDITEPYVARYGEPRVGEKVFIVTRRQKDGWLLVPGKWTLQEAMAFCKRLNAPARPKDSPEAKP